MNKKDLRLSMLIGVIAGLLLVVIVNNFKGGLTSIQGTFIFLVLAIACPVGYIVGALLSKRMPAILQIVKFGEVGGLNFVIDLGVLNILMSSFSITEGTIYSVFKGISFLVAVVNSYFWNKYWTFKVEGQVKAGEAGKFFLVNTIGFGINVGVASIVVNMIGAPAGFDVTKWASIGAVCGSLVGLTWNFVGTKFVVFKK